LGRREADGNAVYEAIKAKEEAEEAARAIWKKKLADARAARRGETSEGGQDESID